MKRCKVCKKNKRLTSFHAHKSCSQGVRSECKDCHNEVSIVRSYEYRKHNQLKRRYTVLKSKYGISREEYNSMLVKQEFRCAICLSIDPGPKKVFSVDHDHKTNKVRALLCYLCNMGLGSFKDDPAVLSKAIIYLKEHGH